MPAKNKSIANEPLEPLIFIIRGHRVILDADLARLYGVNTRVLNQGVRRNSHRFPDDFAFELAGAEVADLRAQAAAARPPIIDPADRSNRSQTVTGSQKHRDPRFGPWGFLPINNHKEQIARLARTIQIEAASIWGEEESNSHTYVQVAGIEPEADRDL